MLRRRTASAAILAALCLSFVATPSAKRAFACGGEGVSIYGNTVDANANGCGGGDDDRGGGGGGGGGKSPEEIYDEKRKANEAAWKKYAALASEHAKCELGLAYSKLHMGQQDMLSCGRPPQKPRDIGPPPRGYLNGILTISPEAAALSAAARLTMPHPKLQIGPDPEWNKWDKVFVGHPYWLWSAGETRMGPVSDSVGGVSVSLRAELTRLTYRTSSGKTIQCDGPGTPYRRLQSYIGKSSPDCGLTFTHVGEDRIEAVAEWTVYWTAGGESGTLPMALNDSRDVVVGELHSVNVEDQPR